MRVEHCFVGYIRIASTALEELLQKWELFGDFVADWVLLAVADVTGECIECEVEVTLDDGINQRRYELLSYLVLIVWVGIETVNNIIFNTVIWLILELQKCFQVEDFLGEGEARRCQVDDVEKLLGQDLGIKTIFLIQV